MGKIGYYKKKDRKKGQKENPSPYLPPPKGDLYSVHEAIPFLAKIENNRDRNKEFRFLQESEYIPDIDH